MKFYMLYFCLVEKIVASRYVCAYFSKVFIRVVEQLPGKFTDRKEF